MDLGSKELHVYTSVPMSKRLRPTHRGMFPSTSTSHTNGNIGTSSRRVTSCKEVQVLWAGGSGHYKNVLTILPGGRYSEVRNKSREENQRVLRVPLCPHFPEKNTAKQPGSLKESTQVRHEAEGESGTADMLCYYRAEQLSWELVGLNNFRGLWV